MPTIKTYVAVVSENEVDSDEVDKLLEPSEHDSLDEYVEEMEAGVEAIISEQLFREADNLPVLDVTTEVGE